MAADTLLAVGGLDTFYGKSHVLRGVSFSVPRGGISVLLGRNGAGKTTTLRSIMGLTPPRAGRVVFKGRDVTGQAPHQVFRLGMGYVPEGRQIFAHLDVGENLRLAVRAGGEGTRWTLERIFEYFPILRDARRALAGARAAARPRTRGHPAPSPKRGGHDLARRAERAYGACGER